MGLKKNFLYNSIITVSGYLFPLLTYPYVSRVLGVSNVGICNFVDSLVNYFVLFSMLGVSAVGIREVSSCKLDKERLSHTFSSILCLNAVTTMFAMCILLLMMYTVPSLTPYRTLLYVGECKLLFNLFLVEWLYTGIEDFAYITKRTLSIKVLYVLAVFVFIKTASDYPWYYILTVSSVCINALINIIHSRKFVNFTFRHLTFRPYLKSFIVMGIYLLITNIYTSLNAAWLGFATNTKEVGYYTTATKLFTIIMAFYTAFSNVMFPRMSSLLAANETKEYWHKIKQAIDTLFAFSFPIVVITSVSSHNLILLMSGKGYEGAFLPLQIIAPLMFVIGYEQILVLQILLTHKQDVVLLRNSIFGAMVAILSNVLFVHSLGAVGSSITWLLSESTILMLSLFVVSKKYQYHFPIANFIKYTVGYLPICILLMILHSRGFDSTILSLSADVLIVAVYTFVLQRCFLKNDVFLQMTTKYLHLYAKR